MKNIKMLSFLFISFFYLGNSYSLVRETPFILAPEKNYELLTQHNPEIAAGDHAQVTVDDIDTLIDSKKQPKEIIPDPVTKINFDNYAFEFSQTPSGAYLTYQHPDLSPEEAIREEIKNVLNRTKKILARLKKTQGSDVSQELLNRIDNDNKNLVEEIYQFLTPLLFNEIRFRKTNKTVFYHGHDNKLRLFFDMLKEFQRYEFLTNLGQAKPLRDIPLSDPITDVMTFLKEFDRLVKECDSLDMNEKIARNCAQADTIYDPKNESGYFKNWYPDNLHWARLHEISLVPSLFTNTHWAANLSESALFYFLNSTNISNPLEGVVLNLIKRFSPSNISQEELKTKAQPFYDIFNKYMSKAGGNMLQLVVDNKALDRNFYLSWRGGTPIWIDNKTKKLATRENKHKLAEGYRLPPTLLYQNPKNPSNKYSMPIISESLKLYRENPEEFMEKFSTTTAKKHEKLDSYAHMQVRGIIHPEIFSDQNKVAVFSSTRFPIDPQDETQYYDELRKLVQNIMSDYLENEVYFQETVVTSPLNKMLMLIKPNIIQLIDNVSKTNPAYVRITSQDGKQIVEGNWYYGPFSYDIGKLEEGIYNLYWKSKDESIDHNALLVVNHNLPLGCMLVEVADNNLDLNWLGEEKAMSIGINSLEADQEQVVFAKHWIQNRSSQSYPVDPGKRYKISIAQSGKPYTDIILQN